jgi:hypothetical protein
MELYLHTVGLHSHINAPCSNVLPAFSFKYWSDSERFKIETFVQPTCEVEMSMAEFCDRLTAWKPGQERLYLQHALTETVGPEIAKDFRALRRNWLENIQVKAPARANQRHSNANRFRESLAKENRLYRTY